MTRIDFIGDVHGHADKLEALLQKLGYRINRGTYKHPERKVFFVGDYIDRGPQIKETLRIVKKMVESNNAMAIMGNHEYNAICFHYKNKKGGHLREHHIKNIIQHHETLKQFQNRQGEYEDYINWFKTLPLFYETHNFRAVHSCWDKKSITYLKKTLKNGRLNDELIFKSVKKKTRLHVAVEQTLKGKEIEMPEGLNFTDKDGTIRKKIRIKWWEDPSKSTYRNISVEPLEQLPEIPVNAKDLSSLDFYSEKDKPVFFGHYWLKGNPVLYRDNVCCLDYSVAKQGYLAAYRFDGEKKLEESKLVYV